MCTEAVGVTAMDDSGKNTSRPVKVQCHVEQLVRDLSVTKNLLVRAMFV
jgi:hypothetical protein